MANQISPDWQMAYDDDGNPTEERWTLPEGRGVLTIHKSMIDIPVLGASLVSGLSPRLRGDLRSRDGSLRYARSIPAPAGEPAGPPGYAGGRWVYPRACGGTHQ